MKANICTLTERGQVSVPVSIRGELRLQAGQRLHWERISSHECRVVIEQEHQEGPIAALGFGARLRGRKGKRTSEWMRELRAGEA